MLTEIFCAAGVASADKWRSHARFVLCTASLMLAGCSASVGSRTDAVTLTPSSTQLAAPLTPSQQAVPLGDAVANLTRALFDHARLDRPEIAGHRTLVVDPLIDHETGNELVATRSMEDRVIAEVRSRYPHIEPRSFNSASLDERPLVLAGSITTVAGPGVIPTSIGGAPKAYRIWAVLADLKSGRIVSHETAWVRPGTVDATPTPFFRDSPAWLADASMISYLKTCAAQVGDPIAPAYLDGLKTAAAVSDGIKAYDDGRYEDALMAYTAAQRLPAGAQLRVYNSVYLAQQALKRPRQAEQAFGQLVEYGLDRGKLSMKLVFRPNSTAFWPDPAISGPYPMWLRQIATQTASRDACLSIVGHTSPTGPAYVNQSLSEARARVVRIRLVRDAPPLSDRTKARGAGSSEPMVGTGKDNVTDVLDRRVEFIPMACNEAIRADAASVH
jgi:outer membrane protein OmpA-like peptidoglycan-associated protein